MNTKTVAQQVIAVAKAQGAEFCEVVVTQNEFALKRIRQGQVDQPPAGEQWGIDVAIVKDGKKKTVSFDNPMFAERIVGETMEQMDFTNFLKKLNSDRAFLPILWHKKRRYAGLS